MKFSITQFEIDKTRNEAKLIKKEKPVKPLGISDKIQHFRDDFRLKFITTFLPKDFPNSVGSGYWPFTKYQFLSNVAGTVTGVLSMQSLLFAVGLGNGSIPMAAALNWIIKDGLGQLGGVIYASRMGGKFDSEPKRHRFISSVVMQISYLMEVFSPLVPHLFLPLASVSNIFKNVSWLANSATRAPMNQSFALHNNLGDITGKSGSQSTAAAVIGTAIGVGVSSLTGGELLKVFVAFIPFCYLSLYWTYLSNNAVITKNLNHQRMETILSNYFEKYLQNPIHDQQMIDSIKLLTPKQVSYNETFVLPFKTKNKYEIVVNSNIKHFMTNDDELLRKLKQSLSNLDHYLVYVKNSKIYLWYIDTPSSNHILQGYYHASWVNYRLTQNPSINANELEFSVEKFECFYDKLNHSGWDTNHLHLSKVKYNLKTI